MPNEFRDEFRQKLNEDREENLSKQISNCLRFLNVYDENHQTHVISDLIAIEVPFKSEVLQKSNNPFVIFDTPGSNNAGNTKDFELLKKQMQDLTNGLPIFVSDYSGLPTTDNHHLIEELQSLEELDQRFTILVVNKADTAKLDYDIWNDEEKKRIKSVPVPKKLATRGLQGIYFVSSIMGLGYKIDGQFIDKQDVRLFKKNLSEYDGSDVDFISSLYKFNILPEQLKLKFEQENSNNRDTVYLNSGLYSIESEIETYANKYSAYNKCQQSRFFLEKICYETKEKISMEQVSLQKIYMSGILNLNQNSVI